MHSRAFFSSLIVQLRERYDEETLREELREMGLPHRIQRVVNPWYYRARGSATWIKIGESEDREGDFWVTWDTRHLRNGQYEVMGLMHVLVGSNGNSRTIARQAVAEVTVLNQAAAPAPRPGPEDAGPAGLV